MPAKSRIRQDRRALWRKLEDNTDAAAFRGRLPETTISISMLLKGGSYQTAPLIISIS